MKLWPLVLFLFGINCRLICVDTCLGLDNIGCGDVGACCKSLNYTISNANAGDIIELQPGIFTGEENINLVISISNLTITSANGPNATTIALGTLLFQSFISNILANNFTLEGISITGMTNFAIYITETADNTSIINCKFLNTKVANSMQGSCINHSSPGKLTMDGCEIANLVVEKEFSTISTAGYLEIKNSIFSNISSIYAGSCVYGSVDSNVYIFNSVFQNNIMNGGNCASGLLYVKGDLQIDDSMFYNFSVKNQPNCPGGDLITGYNHVSLNRCSFSILPASVPPAGYSPLINALNITMNQCTFENSPVVSPILNLYSGATATITGCLFRNLVYQNGKLPLFYNYLGTLNTFQTTFENINITIAQALYQSFAGNVTASHFSSNTQSTGSMLTLESGSISNCSFQYNNISSGSPVYLTGVSMMEVIDCFFDSNHGSNGGGLRSEKQGNCRPTVIHNSTFTNNIATKLGSAIYNMAGMTIVNNCTFSNNSGVAGYNGAIATTTYFANCSHETINSIEYINVTNGVADTLISASYFFNNTLMESGGILSCPQLPNQICNGTLGAGFIDLLITPYDYCGNIVEPYENVTSLYSLELISGITDFCVYAPNTHAQTYLNITCPVDSVIYNITSADWGTFSYANATTCTFVDNPDCSLDVTNSFSSCIGSNTCTFPLSVLQYPPCHETLGISLLYQCYQIDLSNQAGNPWYNIGNYFARNLTATQVGEIVLSVVFDKNITLANGDSATFTIVPGAPSVNNTVCTGEGFSGSAYVGALGIEVSFQVQLYDRYGHKVNDSSAVVVAQVVWETEEINCTIIYDAQDGNYVVEYPIDNYGLYHVTVYLGDQITATGSFTAWSTAGIYVNPFSGATHCTLNNPGSACQMSIVPQFLYNFMKSSYDTINIYCMGGVYDIGLMSEINNTVTILPNSLSPTDVIFASGTFQFQKPNDGNEISITFKSVTFADNMNGTMVVGDNVNLNLVNVTFQNNSPPAHLIDTMGNINITASHFKQNQGNLLRSQGELSNSIISHSTFFANSGNEDMMLISGDLLIANSTFQSNQNALRASTGSLSIFDSLFLENEGCIVHSGTDILITNGTFTSNTRAVNQASGGAILIESYDGSGVSINITNSNFTGNRATSMMGIGLGGAISINSTHQNQNDLLFSVKDCYFDSNVVSGYSWRNSTNAPAPGFGGAISFVGFGMMNIENVSFTQNTAVGGDGIAIVTPGLWRNEFFNLIPSGAAGGAIFTQDTIVSITSSNFESNCIIPGTFVGVNYSLPDSLTSKAYFAKGACLFHLFMDITGLTDIDNCTFTANSVNPTEKPLLTVEGGLIHVQNMLSVSNSVFQANGVYGGNVKGGLISCGNDCTILNSTLNSNLIEAESLLGGLISHDISNLQVNQMSFTQNTFMVETFAYGLGTYSTIGSVHAQNVIGNANKGSGSKVMGIIYAESTVSLENSTFSSNSVESDVSCGGALMVNSTEPFTIAINQCLFANNAQSSQKLSFGGAMWISNPNTTISNCFFSNNSAAFGGGCAVNSSTLFENVQLSNNSAFRAGGAIYFLNAFNDTQPIEFCESPADNGLGNNTAPSGENCASVITDLGFPANSVPITVVYPYQEFTLAFALVDLFGNILQDEDTAIVGNTNFDSEFAISLPDDTQTAQNAGVYLFPECKFIPSATHSPLHEITFQSISKGKFGYNTTLSFTVTTCPPNTASTSTTTACIPCEFSEYSLVPGDKCIPCDKGDECTTLYFLTSNFYQFDSEEVKELSPITEEELKTFASDSKPINSLMKVSRGYWPVPTSNNFTNPTELIPCENCLPFWCTNSFYCVSDSLLDCYWEVDCSYTTPGNNEAEGEQEKSENTTEEECVPNVHNPRCCEGYTNRLCAKCDNNYFPKGEELHCVKCSDADWTVVFIFVDFAISLCLVLVALKFRHSLLSLCVELVVALTLFIFGLESFWNFLIISSVFLVLFFLNSHVNHGILKCFIFYYQTAALVVRPLFEWELPEFASSALTRNGLACYFPESFPIIKFFIIMAIPITTTFVMLAIYFIGKLYLVRKLKSAGSYVLLGDQALNNNQPGDSLLDNQERNEIENNQMEEDLTTEADIDHELDVRDTLNEKITHWPAKCIKIYVFLLFVMYNLISKMVKNSFRNSDNLKI